MSLLFIFSIIFLVGVFSFTAPNSIANNRYTNTAIMTVMVTLVTLSVVTREIVSDTNQYVSWYQQMSDLDWSTARYYFDTDILFFFVQWLMSKITTNPTALLTALWMLFILPLLLSIKRIFNPWERNIVLLGYLCFPFFYSYATVALRQGIAITVVILTLVWAIQGKPLKKIIPLAIAAGLFHWSAFIFSFIILLNRKFNFRFRSTVIVWFLAALMFLTDSQQILLSPVIELIPDVDAYTSSAVNARYSGGTNRLDFLLFSFFWLVVFKIFHVFINRDFTYYHLLNSYVLFNSVYLILGFVAFSDRIASYSWMLIPLLTFYPILKSNKGRGLASLVAILFLIIGLVTGSVLSLSPYANSF